MIDDEFVAIGGRQSGGARALRWLVWLFVIAAFTFAAAFYLPLQSTHRRLTSEYEKLAKKSETMSRDLTARQSELKAVQQERDSLKATVAEARAHEEAASSRSSKLKAKLSAGLSTYLKKGVVALQVRRDTIVLTFPQRSIAPSQDFALTRAAHSAFCAAAATLSRLRDYQVTVMAPLPDASTSKPGKEQWLAAAERGARAAQIFQGCGYPAERLQVRATVGVTDTGPLELRVGSSI